jgi:glutamate racemase
MGTAIKGSIGLFDSGLGGLTVLRELHRSLPSQSYVYLGDSARTPYGTKGKETIIRYARECAGFLLEQQIGILVVACNTASAAALSVLEAELPIPVIGTIEPAVRAALESTRGGRIGVVGTNSTVSSGVYEQALLRHDSDLTVVSQPCPLFVPLVEAGMVSGEIVDKFVEMYFAPFKESGVDTVILGCTHYPLLLESIQAYLGPKVAVVECSRAIARDVEDLLGKQSEGVVSLETKYFVTDEVSKFNYLATAFLGKREVQAVRIESL